MTNDHATATALRALAWTLGDDERAQRLVALTGLYPDDLRARIGEPAVLAAALGYLESYEPDLVACAHDLDLRPEALVQARVVLEAA